MLKKIIAGCVAAASVTMAIPSDIRNLGKFCVKNFSDTSIKEYFSQPSFGDLCKSAPGLSVGDVAKEYRAITGEGLKESVFAALILKGIE